MAAVPRLRVTTLKGVTALASEFTNLMENSAGKFGFALEVPLQTI